MCAVSHRRIEREQPNDVLAEMDRGKHEQVVFVQDLETDLRAIIAIHNTTLGPALGALACISMPPRKRPCETYSISRAE
jgi:glutamate dehydrogenase/leucine dehydrogenase